MKTSHSAAPQDSPPTEAMVSMTEVTRHSAGVDEAFPGYSRLALIKRLLTRLSFCPSDFNTDRCVRHDTVNGDDAIFDEAFDRGTLYSDWTLDGLRLPGVNLPKFRLGVNALPQGQQDCESCPPPQLP